MPEKRVNVGPLEQHLNALTLKQIELEETLKVSVEQLAERIARLEWMLEWVKPRNLRVVLEDTRGRPGRRRS